MTHVVKEPGIRKMQQSKLSSLVRTDLQCGDYWVRKKTMMPVVKETGIIKNQQRKLARLVRTALKCRDSWEREKPGEQPRAQSHRPFVRWVMSHIKTNEEGMVVKITDESVKRLLGVVIDNGPVMDYNKAKIERKMMLGPFGQHFRVVQGCDLRYGDRDRRVRDLFERFMTSPVEILSPYSVICTFFSDIGLARTVSRNRKHAFATEMATRFEQLLYLGTLTSLTKVVKEGRWVAAKKGVKVSKASSQSSKTVGSGILGLKSLRGATSQRVGFVVQFIVRSWDRFVQTIGFRDTEDMLLPYAVVTPPTYKYKALESRAQGFAPKGEAVRLSFCPNPTHVPEETFLDAVQRSDDCDKAIRTLVSSFLKDIDEYTHSSDLFTISDAGDCSLLNCFKSDRNGAPGKRFETFSCLNISAIQEALCAAAHPEFLNEGTFRRYESTGIIWKEVRSGDEGGRGGGRSGRDGGGDGDGDDDDDDYGEEEEVQATGGQEYGGGSSRSPGLYSSSCAERMKCAPRDKTTTELREKLATGIHPFVRMHNCSFFDLIDVDDAISDGVGIENNVQLLLTDPPYNTRRMRNKRNSQYDRLTSADMRDVVSTADRLLRRGGHVILFCTAQQFRNWYKLFCLHETEHVGPTFTVDGSPMVVLWDDSVNNGHPGRTSSKLHCCTEFILHCKKNGLRQKKEGSMVNYMTFNYVASSFAGHTNVLNNVKGLMPGEQIRAKRVGQEELGTSGTYALRSEQKPVALLKELVCRFSQPRDIVVDLFAGTFSTARACVELPRHRRFVGCELDEFCFEFSRSATLIKAADVISRSVCDMEVDWETKNHAIKLSRCFRWEQNDESDWKAPPTLPQYQSLPPHILGHLGASAGDPHFLKKCVRKPVHDWGPGNRGHLEQADIRSLLSVDAAVSGLMVMPSTIKNAKAGRGVFATRTFHPGDTICSYFGTIVYHDLGRRQSVTKTYGDGVLGVTVERFQTYALQIRTAGNKFRAVTEELNGKQAISVVPAEFCVGAYVNDARYWKEDEERKEFEKGTLARPRQQNCVLLLRNNCVKTPQQLIASDVAYLEAYHLINAGQELFTLYYPDGREPES